jgi:capsular polysaccharide biosynthesis protein
VLDAPVISRYRPQTTVNTLAGAILGGLLGGVIIFVLEYIESSVIRSPQDVERVLGLSVMGAIPALETAQASARRRARTSGPPPR